MIVEQLLTVMSVMTKPGWWDGRWEWMLAGRTRKRESRNQMVMRMRKVAVESLPQART